MARTPSRASAASTARARTRRSTPYPTVRIHAPEIVLVMARGKSINRNEKGLCRTVRYPTPHQFYEQSRGWWWKRCRVYAGANVTVDAALGSQRGRSHHTITPTQIFAFIKLVGDAKTTTTSILNIKHSHASGDVYIKTLSIRGLWRCLRIRIDNRRNRNDREHYGQRTHMPSLGQSFMAYKIFVHNQHVSQRRNVDDEWMSGRDMDGRGHRTTPTDACMTSSRCRAYRSRSTTVETDKTLCTIRTDVSVARAVDEHERNYQNKTTGHVRKPCGVGSIV
ncbi:hypothetical protein C8Q72DRAFT_363176 [Fomitopsis betulina]|nr:hypothetical protein C8Q72DRAFT_363176 [Fomitopsis betulina]